MSSTKPSQKRATYDDVKKAQEQLRVLIDELEMENRCIVDKKKFFSLLADSLLGLDYEKEVLIFLPDSTVLRIKNLGKFLRHLAYVDSLCFDFLKQYNKISDSDVCFSDIWRDLKFEIFGLYPEALNMSAKMSKEQTHLGASEAGQV